MATQPQFVLSKRQQGLGLINYDAPPVVISSQLPFVSLLPPTALLFFSAALLHMRQSRRLLQRFQKIEKLQRFQLDYFEKETVGKIPLGKNVIVTGKSSGFKVAVSNRNHDSLTGFKGKWWRWSDEPEDAKKDTQTELDQTQEHKRRVNFKVQTSTQRKLKQLAPRHFRVDTKTKKQLIYHPFLTFSMPNIKVYTQSQTKNDTSPLTHPFPENYDEALLTRTDPIVDNLFTFRQPSNQCLVYIDQGIDIECYKRFAWFDVPRNQPITAIGRLREIHISGSNTPPSSSTDKGDSSLTVEPKQAKAQDAPTSFFKVPTRYAFDAHTLVIGQHELLLKYLDEEMEKQDKTAHKAKIIGFLCMVVATVTKWVTKRQSDKKEQIQPTITGKDTASG